MYEDNDALTVSGNGVDLPVDSYIENLKISVVPAEEDQTDYTELLTEVNEKLDQLLLTEQEKAAETVSENTVSENTLTMPVNKMSAGNQLLIMIVLMILMFMVLMYMGFFPNRRR